MFCSIATTIERCKTKGVVDVFQVVKALRAQKPGAILTVVSSGAHMIVDNKIPKHLVPLIPISIRSPPLPPSSPFLPPPFPFPPFLLPLLLPLPLPSPPRHNISMCLRRFWSSWIPLTPTPTSRTFKSRPNYDLIY